MKLTSALLSEKLHEWFGGAWVQEQEDFQEEVDRLIEIAERLEKWHKKLRVCPEDDVRDLNQHVSNWMAEMLQNILEGKK